MCPAIDSSSVEDFMLEWLPRPPVRVLEVGAGDGDLAGTLTETGYEVTAIDPNAPEESSVIPITLEEFEVSQPYDAIVASRVLHHLHDIGTAFDKLLDLLVDDGHIAVHEFAWDQFDEETAAWLLSQHQQLATAGRLDPPPDTPEEYMNEWRDEHAHLVGFEPMTDALNRYFEQCYFAWCPYLTHAYLDDDPRSKRRELALLSSEEITPTAFRYVGQRH